MRQHDPDAISKGPGHRTTRDRLAEDMDAFGEALEIYRKYLTLMARRELGPDLTAKISGSDLVQETFLAAGRDIEGFRGESAAEFRGWLESILKHLLANTRRRYRETAKRRLGLELQGNRAGGLTLAEFIPTISASVTSASGCAMRGEREAALCEAIVALPAHYQRVIQWHHQERLTFEVIADRLGVTSEAARKIWGRALLKLRKALGPNHDPR
jgi:RNA polymerase sigma-70 factor, ECF subfamily